MTTRTATRAAVIVAALVLSLAALATAAYAVQTQAPPSQVQPPHIGYAVSAPSVPSQLTQAQRAHGVDPASGGALPAQYATTGGSSGTVPPSLHGPFSRSARFAASSRGGTSSGAPTALLVAAALIAVLTIGALYSGRSERKQPECVGESCSA